MKETSPIWQRKQTSRRSKKEAQRIPNKLDQRKHTLRHIIITLPKIKDKERILKAARERETSYLQRSSHKPISLFLKRNLASKKGLERLFKVMKGKDLDPRLLYPAKLSFKMEGQIKCFPDKVKLKEFIFTKPLLYEMLKGLI